MFEKTNETFFASRQINNRKPLELELIESLNVVSIKSDRDHVLIPLTNVSCVYLKSPMKLEQEAKDKKEKDKVGTPSVIKKPRVKRSAY
jgi:hypothetical protein|tara:strand:- start:783 stop:1049 length:267 start_codon:yes stop_codon:yes gene_type:complete